MTVQGDHRRPQDRRPFRLYWCDPCDLGQLQPRPSQAEADSYYDIRYCTHVTDEEAQANAAARRGFLERARVRLAWAADRGTHLDAALVDHLLGGRPSDVLDLGCGNGGLLAALRDRGHRVVGVEPDPVARGMAVARGLEVHAGHADAPPATLPAAGFDAVVLAHVLHLCLDPLAVLERVRASLRPGGLLVCEVVNNEARGREAAGDCWRWLDIPRHLTLFTATSLSRLAARAGLEQVRMDFGGYTRQFGRAWIEDEAQKRATLHPERPGSALGRAVAPWGLLASTALAPARKKYDSVRIVARAPR
jgi:SAM-dependent methyltransferase